MKLKILMLFLILTIVIFSSCSPDKKTKSILDTIESEIHDDDYKTPAQQAEELQDKIMECFVNKDKETLKSYFSESSLKKHDIDKEIDVAFNAIDGKIVSYDEPEGSEIGGLDDKGYHAETENIITDKKTKYTIIFDGNLTCSKHPEKIGITYLLVVNNTKKDELWKKYKHLSNIDKNIYRCWVGDF